MSQTILGCEPYSDMKIAFVAVAPLLGICRVAEDTT